MLITTAHFGELEISKDSIIHFEEGIPGFEELKEFVFLNYDDTDDTFKILQSVDSSDTAFAVVNPFEVKEDYEVTIDDTTIENLEIKDNSDVAICSITTIPDKITRMSANLLAPIVINTTNNKGKQMIMHNSQYTTKHYILDEVLSSALPKSEAVGE